LVHNESEDAYTYAVLFVLFLSGQHTVALNYAKLHASEQFHLMYSVYIKEYGCGGIPRSRAKEFNNSVLSLDLKNSQNTTENKPDHYKSLLVSLMIGSLYKDDEEFRQTYLFGMTDFHTWIYLKLASVSEFQQREEG